MRVWLFRVRFPQPARLLQRTFWQIPSLTLAQGEFLFRWRDRATVLRAWRWSAEFSGFVLTFGMLRSRVMRKASWRNARA